MNDKLKHFIIGFGLSTFGWLWTPLYVLGFIAGWAKELWDSKGHGEASFMDMLATWAGAGTAILIGVIV